MKTNSNLLYISTASIQSEYIIDAVNQLSDITKNIELSGGCEYDKNLLEKLIKIKNEKNINFLIHGYFPPPQKHFILNFADDSENTRIFITETLKYIEHLDVSYYSTHAGFKKTFTAKNDLLFDTLDKIFFALEDVGKNIKWFVENFPDKKIALENLYPNNDNKECCFMMHLDEIIQIMEKFTKVYLLLDLGHLKYSSRLFDFNYLDAVEFLFEKYSNRILEIHLSENNAMQDSHFVIYSDSIQYMILRKYAHVIHQNKINITIESRKSNFKELHECFKLINDALI